MIDVRDFGAIGDGETDDTDAIQRTFDESEGAVRFSAGTYLIERPIDVAVHRRGRTAITGEEGTACLAMAGPGPALHLVGEHAGTAAPASITTQVLMAERLPTIDGIEIAGRHPEADGIRLEGLWQPHLSRLSIHDCRHALHVTKRNRNLVVAECHIHNNRGIGVFYDHLNLHQSNIIGCHISYNRGGGIKVLDSEIRNLQISGNDIEYNFDREASESADIWIETLGNSVREGTITGNTIQAQASPGGANIRFRGHGPDVRHKAGLWTIVGNLITSQETNIHLAYTRGVTIQGNVFGSGHEHAVLLEHCDSIVLSGNSFDHNEDYRVPTGGGISMTSCRGCALSASTITLARGAGTGPQAAIALSRCSEVAVTGVQILDPTPCGISLDDCTHCLVASCMILDRRAEPGMIEALAIKGGSGNRVEGCLRPDVG